MSFDDVIKDITTIYNLAERVFPDRTKKHSFIQDEVYKLAKKYNCIGKREHTMKNAYTSPSGEIRDGRIDVVWYYKKTMILAFEVDSSHRLGSELKLIKVKSKYKVWLCYAKNFNRPVAQSKEIHYILPFYKGGKI